MLRPGWHPGQFTKDESPPLTMHHPSSRSGFTLVELLIVVAIVAMLAAIAVPNFQAAQARAKVARTEADLYAIATGLETYRTDFNGYPVVGSLAFPGPWDMSVPYLRRLRPLTTPVAYINSVPVDAFRPVLDPKSLGPEYCYAPGNLYHGGSAKYSGNTYRNTIYSIAGRGPDREINAGGYCLSHPVAYESKINITGRYDPTNGTISAGDVFRLNCARM